MANTMPALLSPRLQLLHKDIEHFGFDAVRDFWDEIERSTPIVEPGSDGNSLVTFVWRNDGLAQNVAVIQDWGAAGIREHHMALLPGSDVWYLTRLMRSDTRTTYQLSPSPSRDRSELAPYQLDPHDPKIFTAYPSESGDDIRFSLLELPDAPALPWRQSDRVKAGTVQLHVPVADRRRLWVYLPAVGVTTASPMLVVFDGRLYKDLLKLPEMLDYLIEHGHIPPVSALLVDNPDRGELLCEPKFADYMAHMVLPWLRTMHPITTDPRQTIGIGSSFGGLAAAFLAFQHPDVCGTVTAQTGWFRWHPESDPEYHWLARQFAAAPALPIRFWLQLAIWK